jgi:hypothetical protein
VRQQQQCHQHDAAARVVQALQVQLQHHMGAGTSHDAHVQQQQQQQPPWQYHQDSHSSSNTVLQAVPEETAAHASSGRSQPWPAQQQLVAASTNAAVQVQHVSSSSSVSPGQHSACNVSQQQQQQHQGLDEGYCLQLMTVERCSRLWFHLHRAWVGAHMRAALAAAEAPGDIGWDGWDTLHGPWCCISCCLLKPNARIWQLAVAPVACCACSSETSRSAAAEL